MISNNKVALVTGGTGIGRWPIPMRVTAWCLAGRRIEPLQQVVREAGHLPGSLRAVPVSTDVSQPASVRGGVTQIQTMFGRIDAVQRGCQRHGMGFEDIGFEQWNIVNINLTGSFLCAQAAFADEEPAAAGRIINNGSISACAQAHPRLHATKHAITG
jgi:NAD(P)-dependent dehydrogenase (short-subunit alcohol dehydrogenase family)